MTTMGGQFKRLSDGSYDPGQFDLVFVSSADIHGVARGRYVFRSSYPGVVKGGLGMTKAALVSGVMCEMPVGMTDLAGEGWNSGVQMPDPTTLRPLVWLSRDGRKVGHVICDFNDSNDRRDPTQPREIAQIQLQGLKCLGYDVMASALAEFTIFHKDTIEPVDIHEDMAPLLSDLTQALHHSDMSVLSIGPGLEPGKLQISFEEQPALLLADTLHRLRQVARSVCGGAGYDVTFMTQPLMDVGPNRTEYNWRLLDSEQRDVFSQIDQPAELSDQGRHWLAGQLAHNPAISALARPTVNCYSTDEGDGQRHVIASLNSDRFDRNARISLKRSETCVALRDTIATSASNPYLVVASVVAAGIDGISNRLELTALESQAASKRLHTPKNLKDALQGLENDALLTHQLGELFVERFLYLKRDFEVKRFDNLSDQEITQAGGLMKLSRDVYLMSL